MIVRHATPRRNLRSIRAQGLLPGRSRGKLPVVWVHTPATTLWAMYHTGKRHGGRVEDVLVIELDIPRAWLRRKTRGLWYCDRTIGPERFRRWITFGEVASSPVEG